MWARGVRYAVGSAALVFAVAACSGSTDDAAQSTAGDSADCATLAGEVVERLDDFLGPYVNLSPEEFFADGESEGLQEFQDDVAQLLRPTLVGNQTGCTAEAIEPALDAALGEYDSEGLVAQVVVDSIRTGAQRSVRHVEVGPGDDVVSLLALLDTGSSISFNEGTFEFDAMLVIQTGITVKGAGTDRTLISSSAAEAALAIIGEGALDMSSLAVEHVGPESASVILAFGTEVALQDVEISGAVVGADGAGGSGLLVRGASGELPGEPIQAGRIVISDSWVSNNAVAGIVVSTGTSSVISDSIIEGNGECGVCFFGEAGGEVIGNTIRDNGVGIQVHDLSVPAILSNELTANALAGLVYEGAAAGTGDGNLIEGGAEIAIAVQGDSSPNLTGNTIGPHLIAISVTASAVPSIEGNLVQGADVALQVGGQAAPIVAGNSFDDSSVAAILVGDESTPIFRDNDLTGNAAGVVVGGSAAPTITNMRIDGGEVAVSFTEFATGRLELSIIRDAVIGVDARDDADVAIEENEILNTSSGALLFSGRATGIIRSNTVTEPGAIGLQLGGESDPLVESNTVEGGQIGAAIVEGNASILVDNTFSMQDVGVDIGGSSTASLERNQILEPAVTGLVFRDQTTATASETTVFETGAVGVQVIDDAAPTLESNIIGAAARTVAEGDEPVGAGLAYAGDAAGVARNNQIFNFLIGVQVSEAAAPTVTDSLIDGGTGGDVGFLYRDESSGVASGNTTTDHLIAFQISGFARPQLDNNIIKNVDEVGFLLTGDSEAGLSGNTCPEASIGIGVTERAKPTLGENDCRVVRN